MGTIVGPPNVPEASARWVGGAGGAPRMRALTVTPLGWGQAQAATALPTGCLTCARKTSSSHRAAHSSRGTFKNATHGAVEEGANSL